VCDLSRQLPLFALPVEVRRCARNPSRLVIMSATGEVLLRTLDSGAREQDVAERFALAMNMWARENKPERLEPRRYGLSRLKNEETA